MALPTFLTLVNDVLVRMREPAVSTVAENTLSSLVGVFVNDAKRQVNDAFNWPALATYVTVTTVIGTADGYVLTGAGTRFKVNDVMNSTSATSSFYMLDGITRAQYDIYVYGTNLQPNNLPINYVFEGVNTNGDAKVKFWPTPDKVYSIRFSLIIPETDFVNNSDTTLMPKDPIVFGALARALVERGEDGGMPSSEAFALYKSSLADLVSLEASRAAENQEFVAV